MIRIRINNDIRFVARALKPNGHPEILEGKNVTVTIHGAKDFSFEVPDVAIRGNEMEFYWRAGQQPRPGQYYVTIEVKHCNRTNTVDSGILFELVRHTMEEGGCDHSGMIHPTNVSFSFDMGPWGDGPITKDYNHMLNLPRINGVELRGNKSLEELHIQPAGNYVDSDDFEQYKEQAEIYAKQKETEAKEFHEKKEQEYQQYLDNKLANYATIKDLEAAEKDREESEQSRDEKAQQVLTETLNDYVTTTEFGKLSGEVEDIENEMKKLATDENLKRLVENFVSFKCNFFEETLPRLNNKLDDKQDKGNYATYTEMSDKIATAKQELIGMINLIPKGPDPEFINNIKGKIESLESGLKEKATQQDVSGFTNAINSLRSEFNETLKSYALKETMNLLYQEHNKSELLWQKTIEEKIEAWFKQHDEKVQHLLDKHLPGLASNEDIDKMF